MADSRDILADQELLLRFHDLAEAHLSDSAFGTAQLIEQAGMSERTLYRKLRELTGLTPAAYLREVRLEHARHLLEQRIPHTVAEAAYAVGFTTPAYFAKVFWRRYGRRASEFLR